MSERGRPFQRGNTFGKGRPPGSPNKKSLAHKELLLDHGEELVGTTIALAKQGHPVALKLCMERLIPRLKDVAELPVEQSQAGPKMINIRFVGGPGDEVSDSQSAKPGPQLAAPGQEASGSRQPAVGGQPMAQVPVVSKGGPGTLVSRENTGNQVQTAHLRKPVRNDRKTAWS